ncbi:MAG: class I SAM-dependent methyltransferase [Rhodospirillales bacterium]|nr:class I SAM-dependent methyltransferase [Rhodospirillales bacterium]MCB9996677.1 class I SAM-dependent methyltransferase [Rhodospirillales bacterium]
MTGAEQFEYTGKEELDQAKYLPGYNRNIANQLMKMMKPGQALMDFGAGIGTISELVREQAQPESITCLEIDAGNKDMLEGKGFTVITDIAQCPDASIDVVYSSNVLEHIEDDVAALKEIYARLKPGGYASFWVPAWKILWTKMDDRVGHFRRYRRPMMVQAFQAAGFTIDRCYYQDCLGFPVTVLFKLIGDKDAKVTEGNLKLYDNVIFPVSHVLDTVCAPFIGKNLVMHARKPL